MEKVEIIENIDSVFGTVAVPDASDIVAGSSGEAITVKSIFINKKWPDVNANDIIYHNSALGFLSDTAFCYYLPAYMHLLLDDIVEADIVASAVVRQLTLPLEVDKLRLTAFLARSQNTNKALDDFLLGELANSTENVASFIRRMSKMTQEQGRCINNFLLTLSQLYPDYYDENEPIIASQRYWFKYSL